MPNLSNTRERVLAKIRRDPSGCWVWTGYVGKNGYGQVMMNYKRKLAHRAVYELLVGAIPDGLTLDHKCRNRSCVNPDHLEPVAIQENVSRGIGISANNSRKTKCKRGHSLDTAFPVKCKSGNIGRACRECLKLHKRTYALQKLRKRV